MGYFTTLKDKVSSVTNQMRIGNAPMDPLLKENRQMLEAELKLSYESAEGIQALKLYAEEETPALHDALVGTSNALNTIEENRKAMVDRIRIGFVRPFELLVDEWKAVELQKRELKQAEISVEKAEKLLEKKKQKNGEKLKGREIESAEEEVQITKANFDHQMKIRKTKHKAFHTQKITVIKESLGALITERKDFHEQSLSLLDDVKVSLKNINVKNEGKLFVFPETEKVKLSPTTEATNGNLEEKSPSASGIRIKIATITERVTHVDLGLAKVIRENRQILEAHYNLSKETMEGVEAYKTYGKNESKDIGSIITKFANALETIEVNRQAFIEQMKFEFIQPLEKLMEEWKSLQIVIKEKKQAQEKEEKLCRKLDHLKEKPQDKLNESEFSTAESCLDESATHHQEITKKLSAQSKSFGELKAKTLKDSLGSLLERNLKFHDQALNIIGNAETLVTK